MAGTSDVLIPSSTRGGTGGGDMVWVLNAPCGCRSGWLAANYPGAQVIPDEKSAWDTSIYSPVRVERMRAEGFVWTLHTASGVALDDCEHDPYWVQRGSWCQRDTAGCLST